MRKYCYALFGGLLLSFLVVIVWYLPAVAVVDGVTPNVQKITGLLSAAGTTLISAAAGSLFGAWLGAKKAFEYDLELKQQEKNEADVAALNKVITVLSLQANQVIQITREIEKVNSKENAFAQLSAANYREIEDADLTSLSGVIDNFQLILELSVTQQQYTQAMGQLKRRNEHFLTRLRFNSDKKIRPAEGFSYEPVVLEAKKHFESLEEHFLGVVKFGPNDPTLSKSLRTQISKLREAGEEKFGPLRDEKNGRNYVIVGLEED